MAEALVALGGNVGDVRQTLERAIAQFCDGNAVRLMARSSYCANPIGSMPEAKSVQRCPWPGEDPLYVAYHDNEWGVPEYDARALYEKLVLDGFQAGLSWITILRKRDAFRRAFDDFDPERIARYSEKNLERLLKRRRQRALSLLGRVAGQPLGRHPVLAEVGE